MKYIEIDGIKYQIDPNDPTKALEVDGVKVLYVEEPVEVPPVVPAPVVPKVSENMTDEQIEELAKSDPALAKILRENKALRTTAEATASQAEADKKAEMEKNGQFQELAAQADREKDIAVQKQKEAEALLEKYKTTVNTIKDNMMSQIAADKQSLVPEGSAGKQIEYILANSKHLGVSITSKGSPVPKNEDAPIDDEGTDRKRFDELFEKDDLTRQEQAELNELSRKVKAYDTAKN